LIDHLELQVQQTFIEEGFRLIHSFM